MRKPWFWYTIGFWCAVGVLCWAMGPSNTPVAKADDLQPAHTADQLDRTHKGSQLTFEERAGYAFHNLAPPTYAPPPDLKGGALGDASTVRAILFLKGQDRLEQANRERSRPQD